MALDAEELVAMAVAGSHQSVVHPARRVLDEGEDRATPVGAHHVSNQRADPEHMRPAMLHRHELVQIFLVERPGVDDLVAMRVDDLDNLSLAYLGGLPAARRNLDRFCF
jgi:hypothetical protein